METKHNNINKTISLHSPILSIISKDAFKDLSNKEQLYCYYFGKASWEGAKICYFQKSNESPGIFLILQLLYSGQPIHILKENYILNGGTEDNFQLIKIYSVGIFNNCGNYYSFGGEKFIPGVSEEDFWLLIESCSNYQANEKLLIELWDEVREAIFLCSGDQEKIGFPPEQGRTGYYSNNMKREEIDNVDEFLKIVNIDPLNTRIIKINNDHFQVLLASVNMNTQTHFHNKKRIDIVRGDFSPFLRRVTQNLQEALNYTANSYQEQMIKYYIEHFQSGDIEMHKNSQRSWIRDKGPIVETNIGFIESYLDPKQVRAEWEGFSAIVNKNESEKTHNFVKNAEKCLKMMPWPQEFEKDQFLKPDFTSLDVIQNGASMTFAGINIPNYDDIRQNEGFKNVYLKNCIHSRKKADQNFCLIDQEIMKTYGDQVVFHQVIYHELLGHGCGKLFYLKDEQTQSYNFDIENTVNPLNGQKITTFYKEQDTWMSVFQNLSNPYEECRADCVALYFSCFEESFSFLQPEFLSEWQNINKACFLDLISQGINGLQFYDVNEKKWGQAHINGRWVILQVLLEIGEDFLQIQKCLKEHDEEGIEIKLNKDLILTKGKEALSQFLLKMQVYKSTADYQSASKMFNKYSEVSEKFLQIRDIVIKNKKPRRVELQGHLSLDSNKKVVYTCFQESFEGIIESYMARYPYFDLEMYNLFMFYREYNRN